jgi:crotonobetainyl-CoA:carnitine CoA-transferase CaiB-like acyl-CoA transferase
VYACADGKYVAIGSLEPKFWKEFCAKVGKNEWTEITMHPGAGQDKLKEEVKQFFMTRTSKEWQMLLQNEDICFTLINDVSDLANDDYLKERNMFVESRHGVAGNYKTINQPLKFGQMQPGNYWVAPDLGEDTLAILNELNYSEEQIKDLREKNSIKTK